MIDFLGQSLVDSRKGLIDVGNAAISHFPVVFRDKSGGSKGKSPSFNHAWFIWDWTHEGAPVIAYGP